MELSLYGASFLGDMYDLLSSCFSDDQSISCFVIMKPNEAPDLSNDVNCNIS